MCSGESKVVLRLGLKIRLWGKEAGNVLEQRVSKQAGFKEGQHIGLLLSASAMCIELLISSAIQS
jgi:hypothetical protein